MRSEVKVFTFTSGGITDVLGPKINIFRQILTLTQSKRLLKNLDFPKVLYKIERKDHRDILVFSFEVKVKTFTSGPW
jgi:hypothetical protein